MNEASCAHCGSPIPPAVTDEMREQARRLSMILPAPGRPRRFCSPSCRSRAYRRRQAGIAETAYSNGNSAARGHVPMRKRTRAEQAAYWRERARAELERTLTAVRQ